VSNKTFADIERLLKSAEEIVSRSRAALHANEKADREMRLLATSALDQNRLARLRNAIEKFRAMRTDLKPLTRFGIGFLSNYTTDLIVPALVDAAARHGILLEVITGKYDASQ
jgi:hypothetical protein